MVRLFVSLRRPARSLRKAAPCCMRVCRRPARFSVVTPLAECMTLPDQNEAALIRAAQITLRRAILERFRAGPERQKWLRWLISKTLPAGATRR